MKLLSHSLLIFSLVSLVACSSVGVKDATSKKTSAKTPAAKSKPEEQVSKGPEGGEDFLKQMETNIPPQYLYQLLVAEIAGQRGEIEVAVDNYLAVAKATKDPEVAARATQYALYAKNNKGAMEAANIWVASRPESTEARRHLASVYLRQGKVKQAIAEYEKLLALLEKKESIKGFSAIATQLARESDRELAMAVMEKLVETRRDDPEALFALAHLAMRQGRFEPALETLDQILKLRPEWARAVILKSRILAMQGSRSKALAYLKESVSSGKLADNIELGLTYARMLTEAKQVEEAYGQFNRLSKKAPENAEVAYFAGILALQLKKYDDAQRHLEKVVNMGERVRESSYYLGQILEQKKKYQQAITRYSIVKRGEFYFGAQVRIVGIYTDLKEYDRAIDQLHAIHTSSPKQKLQLSLLEGDILREAGRLKDALAYYTKLLSYAPEESSVRYARALVAEQLGDLALVESDLLTILKKEPQNAQALNALGYTLAERTKRLEEALGYIQKALDIEPDDAAVVDSMGWVHYRLGNYEVAIEHLRRANTLSSDPEIAAHLGEVLWVSGKKKEAVKVWESALDKDPDNSILLNVMKKFGL